MKKSIQQDERVLAQKRKIGSDAFKIVWVGLLVSILIQRYLFDAPFAQYAVEFVLFILASFYIIIRNLLSGNDVFSSKRKAHRSVIMHSLICGFAVTIINTILHYMKYSEAASMPIGINTVLVALITFICTTIAAFIPLEVFYLVNKKKQKQIESCLNEGE